MMAAWVLSIPIGLACYWVHLKSHTFDLSSGDRERLLSFTLILGFMAGATFFYCGLKLMHDSI